MHAESREAKVIKVLIGQVALTRSPHRLQAVLGSCIGLVMYDAVEGIAGMAHILLPDSTGRDMGKLPGKYADQAVVCLAEALKKYGARPDRVKAKIAGGARMFSKSLEHHQGDMGGLNVQAVTTALKEAGVPVLASDVGGPAGRKVDFTVATHEYLVESFSGKRVVL